LILSATPSDEPEPFYTELPGVDLTGIPPAEKAALLKRLNRQRCSCDCTRSVASCRNHHSSCSLSIAAAKEAAEAAKKSAPARSSSFPARSPGSIGRW
jgi:hypothetical protein